MDRFLMRVSPPTRAPGSVEVLEQRIAPASFSFTDLDGNAVTITTSRGSDADLAAAARLNEGDAGQFQLEELDLTAPVFQGTNVTIATAGADLTSVGYINATGRDLGTVIVEGDLGQIDAGDSNSRTAALKTLMVDSIGMHGLATQAPGGSLFSVILGRVGTLDVHGDLKDARFYVIGDSADDLDADPETDPVTSPLDARGTIGRISIGGSVFGGLNNHSGSIYAKGFVSEIFVGGDLVGGVGEKSGRIVAERGMGSVEVLGSVVGGASTEGSAQSGQIVSGFLMGSVHIGGSVEGGAGSESGQIRSARGIGNVAIDHSLVGGDGFYSGAIGSAGNIAKITIGMNLEGGMGSTSGTITAIGTIASVRIDGNVEGGGGTSSGAIGSARALGSVFVHGNVEGGEGSRSGQIVSAATIKSITINGSILGGNGFESGAVGCLGKLGPVKVALDIMGGDGERSGIVASASEISHVTVGGNIVGGGGVSSGGIFSEGDIGTVVVMRSVFGGSNDQSGAISAGTGTDDRPPFREGSIRSVTIHEDLVGGGGVTSGVVQATGEINTVNVRGDLVGGAGDASGAVISAGNLRRIIIDGSLLAGAGNFSGRIEANGDGDLGSGEIASVTIGNIVSGAGGGENSAQIFAAGRLRSAIIGALAGGEQLGAGSIVGGFGIGELTVLGNVTGGSGDESGKISTGGDIDSLTLGSAAQPASLIGGSGNYNTSAQGFFELGQVFAAGEIARLRIFGGVTGGDGALSAQVRADAIRSAFIGGNVMGGAGDGSGAIIADGTDISSIEIGGDLVSGPGARSGHIGAARNLGTVTVDALVGTPIQPALITAGGMLLPDNHSQAVALKKLTVRDSTAFADILAGYGIDRNPINPDAQIGTVIVGVGAGAGSWTATNLVAGATSGDPAAGGDGQFGTGDDVRIFAAEESVNVIARIASVVIKGGVQISGAQGAHFGIVAEQVNSLKIGGVTIPLDPHAADNIDLPINSPLADTSLREIVPPT